MADGGVEKGRMEKAADGADQVTVCFGDKNAALRKKIATEITSATFVPCDVIKREDQVHLFRVAASISPSGKVHYVVANAGIVSKDDILLWREHEPVKPDLSVIDINLSDVLYTVKTTLHYFIKQTGTEVSLSQEDTSLILIGSGAAFIDCPRGPQYSSTKLAMRGIMHSMRRTAFYCESRVNIVSPWHVKTRTLSKSQFEHVENAEVQFAEAEDAGKCLLRILSYKSINGRSLFTVARKWTPRGYLDLDVDEYPRNHLIHEIQADQVKSAPVEQGHFPE
ncbi:NAD(P)-binding protein [Lentithecium fluviatile CBS 122367]|uniref:NAD(P)-binding protein n=1 Tax=Lentithecium fluviatile CBS 122367 TaxID=1168545 RepID=A0A6G1IE81_9PLEO|nr:NAD(P)-binding protein [Lentithecium fluviatile CBS 122367]